MPKITSYIRLIEVLADIFVAILAVSSFISIPGRVGVVSMIALTGKRMLI